MTEQELTAIEERANAATMGPWVVDNDTDKRAIIATREAGPIAGMFRRDADFAAASREAVPALVTEVRRLRALVKAAFQEGQDGRILDGHEQFIYDVAWEHSDAFKALEGEG